MKLLLSLSAFVILAALFVLNPQFPRRGHLDGIYFEDESRGFVRVCCPPSFEMYETRDGGKTWHRSESTAARFRFGRAFATSLKGYSVVEAPWPQSEIHVTDDGGKTWRRVFRSERKAEFFFKDIIALSEDEVWAVPYRTRDGGQTWVKTDLPGGSPFFLNRSIGWSIHMTEVWRTEDGGETWSRVGSLPKHESDQFEIGDLFFLNSNEGWLVGGRREPNNEGGALSSVVLHTGDGGQTWSKRALIDGCYARGTFFLNEKIGWIGGTEQALLKTDDGGRTWKDVGFRPSIPE